ncbi:MAG: DNA primase small subunit domain-containing protein, partial [Methanosarcinales archaeon]
KLKSSERREIVDYISGIGLDYNEFVLKKNWMITRSIYPKSYPKRIDFEINEMPTFGKRVANGIIDFFWNLKEIPEKDAIKKLMEIIGGKVNKAESILKGLDKYKTKEELQEILSETGLDLSKEMYSVRKHIAEQVGVKFITGKTDEPVTTDIKRLIRMPTSLHGGSSLRVTPLSMDSIDDFDPLNDAVVWKKEEIKVNALKPYTFEMKDNTFKVENGINYLPEYAAMYLMCRGVAEYEY